MALIDQLFISGVWTTSAVRGNNTVGTPVVSAEASGTGEEISDTYTLTISNRSGGTGDVTVAATSTNNPYHGRVTTGVLFDDTTPNIAVLPGVSIIFDNAGANGNEAEIVVGDNQGTFDASGVGAGVPAAGVRHRVLNDGISDAIESKARLITQAVQIIKTGKVFSYTSPFAENGIEKTAGGGSSRVMPYSMTIDNTAGSGGGKTCDLLIDGGAIGTDYIQDLTDGTLHDGTGLKAVGTSNPYLFIDGPLEGLQFAIHEDCADGDEANILIFPSRYTQIASDTAGVAGTYGTSDVDLTEAGQTTGVITAGNPAYYWVRTLVPASASNESNPYPCNVALQTTEAEEAGWIA